MTLPNPVASSALARPAHPAVVASDGASVTWGALAERCARAAAGLAARGVRPAQRVALVGPASVDWLVALHAIGWLGAVAVPLPAGRPRPETAGVLALVGATHQVDAPLDCEHPPLPERDWPADEERFVVASSGSSGAPTAVALTTAQLAFSAFGSAVRLGHLPGDRWLLCLPVHHVGGLSVIVRCAFYGITTVMQPRFDVAATSALIDAGEVTLVSLVPEMLRRLFAARAGRPFPASLRVLLIGGAPTPPELLADARNLAAPVALTWGMTEAASQIATRFAGDLSEGAGSGPVLPFARVAAGPGGRLVVTGPIVGRGALLTADAGTVDAAGRVHVSARVDDVILSGGENLDPAEIERVLTAHPGVIAAAVVAAPDARWGQRPVAWVVLADPAASATSPTERELDGWCRERIASFKCPARYVWTDALPRTDLGKVRRGVLRLRPETRRAP